VKKGIVAILVILALIVLVSPGLVGRLAEKSVDEQLQWAATENKEVVITSEKFDRGWFSSEGRHRIELGKTGPGMKLREQLGFPADGPSPAVIIETRLDHGLIPVSSITRAEGSLAPGLGRAVSTVSIESIDGDVTELPGTIYSKVGLDGGLASHYFLDAGSMKDMSWGAGDVEVSADTGSGRVIIDGGFDSFTMVSPDDNSYSVGKFELSSDMTMTDYGYSVGDMAFVIDSMNISSEQSDVTMGPFKLDATSELDDDRVNVKTKMNFAVASLPPIGDIAWSMDMVLTGLDAAATGRLQKALERAQGTQDPTMLLSMVEDDLMDLAAGGFEMRFDQLDVTLPQGTVFTKFAFDLPASDRQSFAWTGVLLSLEASADIKIPSELYDMATAMNPQANMAVAMGILKKNGDTYEMTAEYKKGLLTVNGAPMPIPLPGS